MDNINKFQSLIILLMVLIGIILGQINIIQTYSEYLIMPSLIIMLFLVFIQIPLKDITKSFKNIKFTLTAILINFVWTPILIFFLGKFFLQNSPELLIGFIMLMVTPCTDWYLIFTAIAKGNVALGASILPLNFMLQLLLLPVYVFLIGGSSVNIDALSLTQGMVVSLFIPLLLATIFRKITINKKGLSYFEENISPKACDYQGYFLNLAIISMFASQGKVLLKNPQVLLQLLLPVLLFFIINLVIGQVVGRKIKLSKEDNVALSLTTLARNSPIALAIAVSAFPNEPLISLALVIGPLIELPVLFLVSKILLNINNKINAKNIY
ncbi:bile acid:sodium symporter [Romboutsia sp. 1001216sp1]|uniref:arsenic resistance protein n=1 Tax=unclassified Romboutsia TaxID=2626894 RepID=UPI0018AA14F8|nr:MULTISPECIES: bile acid:sodium symporter [unclassified Romboutsia]MDB8792548.1 bile acid:sodium symporter [Romboutsia sp. 1001216sp1]MDB8796284.1 bile acid:sodium symporter [Romboutsia sp. 1001216sp1]MDB8798278.1 bile acid:sodium symporter [Romboutsia sp. 1001216sp1]MDB8803708.1 bile acid:sodium symporter [Romboutsia sp. 1001216sp1]MDB8806942.1 bile acid:sodium symporter [Romboutsia sp. 1001216sp1]